MPTWLEQQAANDPDGLGAWIAHERSLGGNSAFPSRIPFTPPQANEPGQAVNYPNPQGGGDFQQQFMGIMGGGMATPDALIAKEAELAKLGIKVLRNASGVAGKVQLPSGEIVDVIQSAGTGGGVAPWTWQQGPGGPTGEGGRPLPGNQFYGQPGSAPGTLGGMTDYGARLPALQKTPGYQFVRGEALKAVEEHAASKGTLLTGGAIKDAQDRATGLASTEFDNEYRRLFGLAGLGQGAAGAIGQYGSSYGDNSTNLITGAGDARAAGTIGSGNAWQGALGGIGNTAMNAFLYSQFGKPQTPAYNPYAQTPGYNPYGDIG